MLAFLYNNATVIIFIVIVLLLSLMYFHFKSLPAKVKKKEEKKEEKKEKKQEPAAKEEEKPEEVVETKQEETIDEEKGKAKNSKVSHIYKRPTNVTGETKEKVPLGEDSEYDAEFVNVSKNVSRFKGLVAKEEELKELVNEAETNEFGFVTDKQEDCDFCENKTSHFDHSRRLSNFVKDENFDGMFASHISDYYMNMDGYGRHLGDNDRVGNLYDKAEKTIKNSEKKLSSSIVEKSIIQSEIENIQDVVTDDDLKSIADLRTIVITDSIMNRKKKK